MFWRIFIIYKDTNLYEVRTCEANDFYSYEYSTNYITTPDNFADVLCDEDFKDTYIDVYFEEIKSYSIGEPSNEGNIPITITYLDCLGDIETTEWCLWKMKNFM